MKKYYNYLDKLNTPCYIIDTEQLRANCNCVMDAFSAYWGANIIFGYSVKTNNNSTLMSLCGKEFGWYIETVSSKEYNYAVSLGYRPDNIILNGPHKEDLLIKALSSGSIVNLDNLDEVYLLCKYAKVHKDENTIFSKSKIGLRVNFDLEKVCPNETTMGDEVSKFGICYENGDLALAISKLAENHIPISGLHMHTSTTTRSTNVFCALSEKVIEIVQQFNLNLSYIDIGGGFFGGKQLPNKPSMQQYANTICNCLKKLVDPNKVTLILEPGVSVIATSIEYVTKVINTRDIRGKQVITTDGTLLHINPFMVSRNPSYIIFRDKQILQLNSGNQAQIICGATCMEKDRFFSVNSNTIIKKEDFIIFKDAGAYTMSFNSDFILKKPKIYTF